MNPRAEATNVAPAHKAQATSADVTSLPEAMIGMRAANPCLMMMSYLRERFVDGKAHIVHQRHGRGP